MNNTNYELMFEDALAVIYGMPVGTMFVARDLFKGTEWNSLEKGSRLGFGGFFKRKVMQNLVPNVQYIGKKDNNSAQYMKYDVQN